MFKNLATSWGGKNHTVMLKETLMLTVYLKYFPTATVLHNLDPCNCGSWDVSGPQWIVLKKTNPSQVQRISFTVTAASFLPQVFLPRNTQSSSTAWLCQSTLGQIQPLSPAMQSPLRKWSKWSKKAPSRVMYYYSLPEGIREPQPQVPLVHKNLKLLVRTVRRCFLHSGFALLWVVSLIPNNGASR